MRDRTPQNHTTFQDSDDEEMEKWEEKLMQMEDRTGNAFLWLKFLYPLRTKTFTRGNK